MGERNPAGATWTWLEFDRAGTAASLRELGARVAEVVAAGRDPDTPCPPTTWTTAETAAHLVAVIDDHEGFLLGRRNDVDPTAVPEANARNLALAGDRDLVTMAARIEAGVEAVAAGIAGREAEATVPWHGDTELPACAVGGMLVGELLFHGQDLAAAGGAPWPMEEGHARHIVRAVSTTVHLVADPDACARRPVTYAMHVRGHPTSVWRFDADGAHVEPHAGQPVHCHVRARPVPWALAAYGRCSPLRLALTGRALAWGTRPFAAFRLTTYRFPV